MALDSDQLTFQQHSIIATLKDHANYIDGAIDTIERKAHDNFTTVNIIAAIVGVVNLGSLTSPALTSAINNNLQSLLVYVPTALLVVTYVVAVVAFAKASKLTTHGSHPILVTEEEIKRWETYSVADYYKCTVDAYIDIYKENECLSNQKARYVRCTQRCLYMSIGLVFTQAVVCIVAACVLSVSP